MDFEEKLQAERKTFEEKLQAERRAFEEKLQAKRRARSEEKPQARSEEGLQARSEKDRNTLEEGRKAKCFSLLSMVDDLKREIDDLELALEQDSKPSVDPDSAIRHGRVWRKIPREPRRKSNQSELPPRAADTQSSQTATENGAKTVRP